MLNKPTFQSVSMPDASAWIEVDGRPFDASIHHFSFGLYDEIGDSRELAKLADFKNLSSASFACTKLGDEGLTYLSMAHQLEHLNLQETNITNQGLLSLARLPRLLSLRLKDNPQLDDGCIPSLLRMKTLVELQIHGTSIRQPGLDKLAALQNLHFLCVEVREDNFTYEGLVALSRQMPSCEILAKGRGSFRNGSFEGQW